MEAASTVNRSRSSWVRACASARVRTTAKATCDAISSASASSSRLGACGRSEYSMNFPITRRPYISGMNAIAAMPSASMVGRNGPSDASSLTSATTIGTAPSASGLHGEWPSTARLYDSDSPRAALKRITPSGSNKRIDARATPSPAASASSATS